MPHRKRITIIRKSGCGRGVLGLALALTLDQGLSRVSLGTVCCPMSSVSFVLGPLSTTLFLLSLA